jgi:hypothetical protein
VGTCANGFSENSTTATATLTIPSGDYIITSVGYDSVSPHGSRTAWQANTGDTITQDAAPMTQLVLGHGKATSAVSSVTATFGSSTYFGITACDVPVASLIKDATSAGDFNTPADSGAITTTVTDYIFMAAYFAGMNTLSCPTGYTQLTLTNNDGADKQGIALCGKASVVAGTFTVMMATGSGYGLAGGYH